MLKLFFNPNPLIQALHIQSRLNTMYGEREARREATRRAFDQLHYEVDAQPRDRDDAHGHRGQEPEDARRIADRPPGVQRAARARARKRRRLQAVRRRSSVGSRHPRHPRAARDTGPSQPTCRRRGLLLRQRRSRSPPPSGDQMANGSAQRTARRRPGQRSRRRRRRRGRRGGGRPRRSMGQPGGPQTAESSGEAQDTAAERAAAVESNPPQHGTPSEDRSSAGSPGASDRAERPGRSEARRRRPAIRSGDQRRRRAARALHRRASRAPRRGRGPDDVRDRLRHVAERAARRRRAGQRRRGAPISASSTSAIRSSSASAPSASSTSGTRSPTSSTGWMPRGRRARRSSTTSRSTRPDYDYFIFFSYRYYHAYSRRSRRGVTRDPGADGRARLGDRPVDVRADLPRRSRADVQLARRAGHDSGASPATTTCRSSSSASDPKCPQNPQPDAFRQKFDIRGPFARLCRPHRREQGLQGAVRVLPGLHPRERRAGCRSCWSATRCCRSPSIRGSATSAFSTTPTSSTRWPRPTC